MIEEKEEEVGGGRRNRGEGRREGRKPGGCRGRGVREAEGKGEGETDKKVKCARSPLASVCVVGLGRRHLRLGTTCLRFSGKLLCLWLCFASTDLTTAETLGVVQGCLATPWGLILEDSTLSTAYPWCPPTRLTPALVKSPSLHVFQRFLFFKENAFLYGYKSNMQPHKKEVHTAVSLDFFLSFLLHLHVISSHQIGITMCIHITYVRSHHSPVGSRSQRCPGRVPSAFVCTRQAQGRWAVPRG